MIVLKANGRELLTKVNEPITTGSIGLPVMLTLSDDYDGLAVVVCFEAGEERADLAYLGDPMVVPPQCLTTAGYMLMAGVYALAPDGTVAIPTVWAACGTIRNGTVPDFDPHEPAPSWPAQVQLAAQEAKETAERLAANVEEWADAEEARATAEGARVEAEGSRTAAESERATAEQARATAESARAGAERSRITAETARANAEATRAGAEANRASAETSRASAEEGRVVAESARTSAESRRVSAESARVTAEQLRQDAESSRASAEEARAAAEGARATAETARASAESARANAEGARVTAENGRASAESTRAQEWADLKADAEAATEAATEAAAALRPEVDWLRGNQLTKELSGELMQASDAYGAPVLSLGIDGKSTQASTTGKNLLDLASNVDTSAFLGISKTINADGSLTLSGTATSTYTYITNEFVLALPVGTYTLSISQTLPHSVYINVVFKDGTNVNHSILAGQTIITFTIGKPVAKMRVLSAYLTAGTSYNETFTIQLESGTTATSFEPYTDGKPSPSPDYPQPIESVDELTAYLAGTNLLDLASNVDTSAFLGISKTINADGSLTLSGTATSTYTYITNEFVLALPVGTYTLSISQTLPHSVYINVVFKDGTDVNHSILAGQTIRTFTIGKPVAKMRVLSAYLTAGTSYNETFTIQLERGSSATAFVPYEGHNVPIPLQDHVLRSLPDGTKDTLALTYLRPSTREGWAWYGASLVQRVDKLTLDGTQSIRIANWRPTSTSVGFGYASSTLPIASNTLLSDKLLACAYNDLYFGNVDSGMANNADAAPAYSLFVRVPHPELTTNALVSAWLADNPITVDYPLATPVTHDLGEIELPVLPAPTCTVLADPTTGLAMEYVRDTNIIIAGLQAAIADLATS